MRCFAKAIGQLEISHFCVGKLFLHSSLQPVYVEGRGQNYSGGSRITSRVKANIKLFSFHFVCMLPKENREP